MVLPTGALVFWCKSVLWCFPLVFWCKSGLCTGDPPCAGKGSCPQWDAVGKPPHPVETPSPVKRPSRDPGALHEETKLAGCLSLAWKACRQRWIAGKFNCAAPDFRPLCSHLALPCSAWVCMSFTLSVQYLTLPYSCLDSALLLPLHLSDAWSVCMVGHLAHVHQTQAGIKD